MKTRKVKGKIRSRRNKRRQASHGQNAAAYIYCKMRKITSTANTVNSLLHSDFSGNKTTQCKLKNETNAICTMIIVTCL